MVLHDKTKRNNCGNGCLGKRSSALTGNRRLIISGEWQKLPACGLVWLFFLPTASSTV